MAFQVAEVPEPNRSDNEKLWSVRPGEFTASYHGSYQGPLYATTGTCATACKKESVGQGSCAELSIGGTATDKRVSLLGRFQFGVRQSNRIFAGDGVGYTRIGDGPCAAFLDSQDVINQLSIRETLWLKGAPSEALQECARQCKTKNVQEFDCHAFTFDHSTGRCWLHEIAATTVKSTSQSIHPSNPAAVCYSATPSWPLDIYQPWNLEWGTYVMNLDRMAHILMGANESAELKQRALQAVKRAYAGYCGKSKHCYPPEEWQEADAVQFLRFSAPLSVDQLRQVREETEPGSTEDLAKPWSTIAVKDLLVRPNGFGGAWRSFLGPDAVSEAAFDETTSPRRDKTWVQQLEARAMQHSLRTADGHWDLQKAAAQLEKEQAI